MALVVFASLSFGGCAPTPPDVVETLESSTVQSAPASGDPLPEEVTVVPVPTLPEPTQAPAPKPAPVASQTPAPVVAFAYKDGTYTQAASYNNPAGGDSVTITITVKGDKVTVMSSSAVSSNPTTLKFQQLFRDGLSARVVGKSLDSIGALGAVNGSSLTPKGFNSALASLKQKAKA